MNLEASKRSVSGEVSQFHWYTAHAPEFRCYQERAQILAQGAFVPLLSGTWPLSRVLCRKNRLRRVSGCSHHLHLQHRTTQAVGKKRTLAPQSRPCIFSSWIRQTAAGRPAPCLNPVSHWITECPRRTQVPCSSRVRRWKSFWWRLGFSVDLAQY